MSAAENFNDGVAQPNQRKSSRGNLDSMKESPMNVLVKALHEPAASHPALSAPPYNNRIKTGLYYKSAVEKAAAFFMKN